MVNNYITILEKLDNRKNVLLMGAPGTGKSKLMNEVAECFLAGDKIGKAPSHDPDNSIPIPDMVSETSMSKISFITKENRKVFRTTFHQNTKYRDFLTGIVPTLQVGSTTDYTISEGILYRANEFAKQSNSAALLIIDEINRGPAIEIFGGSIVAFESDKRLKDDGTTLSTTQFFELLDPKTRSMTEYAFSNNLYILAAMNQADASVAPLDVAFLRRWHGIRLKPDYAVLYNYFNITENRTIKEDYSEPRDIYYLAIKALEKINERISLGRGEEYQIGHGIFMTCGNGGQTDVTMALEYILDVWSIIYSHIEELFFGDSNSIAAIIGAANGKGPFMLREIEFANEYKSILIKPEVNKDNIYEILFAVLGE